MADLWKRMRTTFKKNIFDAELKMFFTVALILHTEL